MARTRPDDHARDSSEAAAGPGPLLRPLHDTDHAFVLALNERNVEALAPMDEHRLVEIAALADRFDVVEVDGVPAGFVVTVGPGSTYDSENYRWFADHFGGRFYYLDRIVLDEPFRRRGLGAFVYDAVEQVAAPYSRLALEVNLVPRNRPSLEFHTGRGFVEVSRRGDDQHLVSLMEKRL